MRFHPVARLTREDVAAVVAQIARRVIRLVERRGLARRAEDGEAPDVWSEEAPVLAAVAAASVDGRVALGPRAGARVRRCGDSPEDVAPANRGPSPSGAYQWAELMRRSFGLDVLACSRCGGRLRLVALIDQASVIQRILRHVRLPTELPEPRPARAPPWPLYPPDDQFQNVAEFDGAW